MNAKKHIITKKSSCHTSFDNNSTKTGPDR